jgi:hypothetical protein
MRVLAMRLLSVLPYCFSAELIEKTLQLEKSILAENV